MFCASLRATRRVSGLLGFALAFAACFGCAGESTHGRATPGTGGTAGAAAALAGRGDAGGASGDTTGGGAAGGAGGGAATASDPSVAACIAYCNALPTTCNDYSSRNACLETCEPLPPALAACESSMLAAIDCFLKYLDPSAVCTFDEHGACVGMGCSGSVRQLCLAEGDAYGTCLSECKPAVVVETDTACTSTHICRRGTTEVSCTRDDTVSNWVCACRLDGAPNGTLAWGMEDHPCLSVPENCHIGVK